MSLLETPAQTIGPFFAVGLLWPEGPEVVPEGTPGAVRIAGRVLDGAGGPVPDALVETWQADPDGRFAHPDDPRGPGTGGFRVRALRDRRRGRWAVRTTKPGPLPAPGGGVEGPASRRVGVRPWAALSAGDPDLLPRRDRGQRRRPPAHLHPRPAVRARLVAGPDGDGLRFDIHLQGTQETLFLAI